MKRQQTLTGRNILREKNEMKNILNVMLVALMFISQSATSTDFKKDLEVPVFFKNNQFSPEGESTRLKGVQILSVDDEIFPKHLKPTQRKLISEIKKNGFLRTEKSKNSRVKQVVMNKKLERSLNQAAKLEFDQKSQSLIFKLKLNMSDLTNTSLKNANLVDIVASGALQDSGWTGVSRIFEDEYFGIVILEEDDFSLHGGGVILTAELINASVNGNAAMMMEERDENNKPFTTLQWASDHKSFVLKVAVSASKGKPLENLIALAESLQ